MNIDIMKLRDYQEKCVNDVQMNKKNLIHLATGGGKSVIFKHLINEQIKKNNKVLFLVAGVSILDQAIKKHFKDISKDVKLNDLNAEIACFSVDTLARRKKLWPLINKEFDYIVIDEAHNCTAKRYTNFFESLEAENKTFVGLTATPYKIGKKAHTFWNNVIHPISVKKLIKKDHLVFPKCYVANIEMNTKVKKTAGDFNNKELFQKNDNLKIYGSIINEYKKHGLGKKAVCFAVNVEHSLKICEEFNNQGIKAVHADANTSLEDREKILKEFEHGNIQVLCNVNIFSTGIDIPIAEVGIMARPTQSRVLWIQQVGRLLRPYKNKKYAIILDHGGNTHRLGHPIEDFKAETTKNTSEQVLEYKVYTCPKCFYVYDSKTNECPSCGFKNKPLEKKKKEKEIIEARLEEYRIKEIQEKKNKYKNWAEKYVIHEKELPEYKALLKLLHKAETFELKPNWVFYEMKKKFPQTCELVLKYPFWFNR
jgi:superfamily II DNA or RNA helicase